MMSSRSWLYYGIVHISNLVIYNELYIGEYVRLMHGRYLKRSMKLEKIMMPAQRVKRWKNIELWQMLAPLTRQDFRKRFRVSSIHT